MWHTATRQTGSEEEEQREDEMICQRTEEEERQHRRVIEEKDEESLPGDIQVRQADRRREATHTQACMRDVQGSSQAGTLVVVCVKPFS